MISVLAGICLIFALFSLSTLEGIFERKNWTWPISFDCKKYVICWLGLSLIFSLLIVSVDFLLNFYNFLDDKNKPKSGLI